MYWETRYAGQIWSAEHGREWKLWSPSNFPSCNSTTFSWWRNNCSQIGLRCTFTYLNKLFPVLLLHYGAAGKGTRMAGVPQESRGGIWHLETCTKTIWNKAVLPFSHFTSPAISNMPFSIARWELGQWEIFSLTICPLFFCRQKI